MDNKQFDTFINTIKDINHKGFSFNGVNLLSGANTIKGDFYGLAIGALKPTSIKITPKNNILLNGTAVTIATELIDFFVEGEFIPIEFTEIIITGTGFVKCFNK